MHSSILNCKKSDLIWVAAYFPYHRNSKSEMGCKEDTQQQGSSRVRRRGPELGDDICDHRLSPCETGTCLRVHPELSVRRSKKKVEMVIY